MKVTLRNYNSINNGPFNDNEIQNVQLIKTKRWIEKYEMMRGIYQTINRTS